jgi:hypothetical protein
MHNITRLSSLLLEWVITIRIKKVRVGVCCVFFFFFFSYGFSAGKQMEV